MLRSEVIAALRMYFTAEGFIEVETPALQVSPGLDRHTKPFETTLTRPFKSRALRRFLHTSPEFSMKKLLSAGETKIFQISHVFRDGEESKIHHPEFTLLEWYRTEEDYKSLISDLEKLVDVAASSVNAQSFRHEEVVCDMNLPWQHITVAEAFALFADIDLFCTFSDLLVPSGDKLAAEANRVGVRCGIDDTWDDIFHKILLEKVDPHLKRMSRVMLRDYPTPVGALARRSDFNPKVCERVEAYICGVELANGFSELVDPVEQRARFERDLSTYASLYGRPPPIDESFLAALEDMPQAAGMALGVDRLVMLLAGADNIRDILWMPVDVLEKEK